MRSFGGRIRGGGSGCRFTFCAIIFLYLFQSAWCALSASDVLILVNGQSPTSRYIARMYRFYYPSIQDWQVLELQGLTDCSGPSAGPEDEIITRQQYDECIAGPLRDYLLDLQIQNTVKVLITTAGLPYRIEDTHPQFADVIKPAASNWTIVKDNEDQIDAASVESELTCLWYSDCGSQPFGLANRMVNPYQACRSEFDLFERNLPNADGLRWTYGYSRESGVASPLMEGYRYGYGVKNRVFGPGHIYLVCRLDGPKDCGQSAIFSVRQMLERAKRASSSSWGINPLQASVILDDAPMCYAGDVDYNRVYNLQSNSASWEYTPGQNAPPNAYLVHLGDDYVSAYEQMTGQLFMYSHETQIHTFSDAYDLPVILNYSDHHAWKQSDLDELTAVYPGRTERQTAVAFACFGTNGDEGFGKQYLLSGQPDQGAVYLFANGAVFCSLESFNAVSFFSDAQTSQAKIIDFIAAGGTGAIGHSFEPQADAAVDVEFFFMNLLADRNQDGLGDLTFIEAAYSAIPYLSWSEVVIGDPLMRIKYTENDSIAWTPFLGDMNMDDIVNSIDVASVRWCNGGMLTTDDSYKFNKYYDLCDMDQNGLINSVDVYFVRYLNGSARSE